MQPEAPSDRAFDVIGIGATSIDDIYLLPACPAPTAALSKLRITRHVSTCGGQIATALAACARFGLRTRFAGVVGNDDNGGRIRRELAGRGVDMSGAIVRAAPNQHAVILIDERGGERIVLWDRSDALTFGEADVASARLGSARVLHLDDVDLDGAIRAAAAARANGTVVTTDLDRVTDRTLELVRAATFPIFAEHVPGGLTGIDDPAGALRVLQREHPGVLCVTLGPRGALALDGDTLHASPAFGVDPVDTTGAGDVFRAGFVYAHLQGWPIDRVLRFANAAAAVSCTRLGAMAGVPALEEVQRLIGVAP
jgi:sulfofructose kinase